MTTVEIRAISCSKCDPDVKDPEFVKGDGYLKYMLYERKCRVCGTVLTDLGKVDK